MENQDIINAYEWFKKRTEDYSEQRKLIESTGVTLSEYFDEVQKHNLIAYRIIEAYALKKGLIDNDK